MGEGTEAPKEGTEAPKEETEAPQEETEAPMVESKAPKVEIEAPKEENEAPKDGTEAPKEESGAPQVETASDVKNEDIKVDSDHSKIKLEAKDPVQVVKNKLITNFEDNPTTEYLLKSRKVQPEHQSPFKIVTYTSLAILFCMVAYLMYRI